MMKVFVEQPLALPGSANNCLTLNLISYPGGVQGMDACKGDSGGPLMVEEFGVKVEERIITILSPGFKWK